MSLKQMRPLPPTIIVEPTQDQVDFFQENGFLAVDRITTDEELEWLTELYEHIFDPANSADRGAPVDRSTRKGENGSDPRLTQAFMPEFNYPQLLETSFNQNGRRFAAALMGVDIHQLGCWGHMIRKMPGGREVPWHQDEAFWEPEFEYRSLGCWLPLHDVSEEMGTMQFIPGSHKRGVLPHQPQFGDVKLHVLTADFEGADLDASTAVVCPLTAGGATFHHSRTLHHTAPNMTGRPRLAFPYEFEAPPVRREVPAEYDWVDDWRAATNGSPPKGYVADAKYVSI